MIADFIDPAHVATLAREIGARHSLPLRVILGREQDQQAAHARADVMRALRDEGHSLPAIGRALNRHHTTVLHWIRKGQANG